MHVVILGEQLRRRVPGGIGTYLRGLLQGLDQLGGIDVTLLSSRLAVPVMRSADVVHAPSLFTRPTRAPLSVMVHDLAWRAMPDAFTSRGVRWHERALRHVVRRARVLLVPSQQTADALGVADGRVQVVEEGCDHLPPPDHDRAAKVLAGLGVHGPFLLTLSTIEPRKNLPRLLAAYRRARARLPEPWPLVVVGPAGWGPGLAPEEGVSLAGFVDEALKSALLAEARVLVYVPLLEGWGLPPTEAMAAGTPVVASPMPSIGDGAGALVVDPTDVASIADALVEAASDDGVRGWLVAAGAQRAAQLTWREAARRHVELWETL
jgi:glycosyltransferase involved in cell wall biosynthesis